MRVGALFLVYRYVLPLPLPSLCKRDLDASPALHVSFTDKRTRSPPPAALLLPSSRFFSIPWPMLMGELARARARVV